MSVATPAVRTTSSTTSRITDPQLGHDGRTLVICLPGGERIPVIAPRVRAAKAALAKLRMIKPGPDWTAQQHANLSWRLRAAADTLRDEIADAMREYGITFVDGVPTVRRDRWIGEPPAAVELAA